MEAFDAAIDDAFASNGVEYAPDAIDVPHPNFELFAATAEAGGVLVRNGRYIIAPAQREVLEGFAGLRGFAQTRVETSNGPKTVTGPAIVLPGGSNLALLTAEASGTTLSDMQHALLNSEYAKYHAKVKAEHQRSDVRNAGEIGAALIVASTVWQPNPHQDMHDLAGGVGRTFGANFAADGRQDLQVRHETRFVRSAVVPVSRVVLQVCAFDQLPEESQPLGLELTADELAVGMTLAATTSRGRAPDLRANLTGMVEA